MAEKITVSWDDLNTRKVETRLKEQAALARNRAYAKLEADQVTPQPSASASSRAGTVFYNAAVYMTVFGLLGGLLAWVVAQVVTFKPSPKEEAIRLLKEIDQVRTIRERGRDMSDAEIGATIAQLKLIGRRNPYFAIAVDPNLSEEERSRRELQLSNDQRMRVFVSNVLAYGACGLLIAAR